MTAEKLPSKSFVQDEPRTDSWALNNLEPSFSVVKSDRAINKASLLDRIANAAHSSINFLASVTSRRLDQTKQVLITSSDTIQSSKSNLTAQHKRLTTAVRSDIRNKPLSAIGAALIVGIIFEKLTVKRR
ncbi:MAG: hypothetical protein EOO38_20440 [Cytophagaceae bacterium]|nr:MAG: hypothetical protein EOO38_20440 [Cytophagaceae bacterium]